MAVLDQTAPTPAEPSSTGYQKRTREEVRKILEDFQQLVREHNPENRDLLAEFLAERREAAARGD